MSLCVQLLNFTIQISQPQSFRIAKGLVKSVNAKLEQNTLMLRDIAETTPSGAILEIFASASTADGVPCPPVQSVRADVCNTW